MFIDDTRVLRAMAGKSRQRILTTIEKGVKNPGKIGRELGMPRSTVEKHLRLLVAAGVVEKKPILTPENRLGLSYEIMPIAYRIRAALNEEKP
jgi:DNA-binding transcriptional ArsR family regulator